MLRSHCRDNREGVPVGFALGRGQREGAVRLSGRRVIGCRTGNSRPGRERRRHCRRENHEPCHRHILCRNVFRDKEQQWGNCHILASSLTQAFNGIRVAGLTSRLPSDSGWCTAVADVGTPLVHHSRCLTMSSSLPTFRMRFTSSIGGERPNAYIASRLGCGSAFIQGPPNRAYDGNVSNAAECLAVAPGGLDGSSPQGGRAVSVTPMRGEPSLRRASFWTQYPDSPSITC